MMRFNGYSLRAHREAFAGNGQLLAFTDAFYYGHRRGNDYDELSAGYMQSDVKPDKQFSILPTLLSMVGNCDGKYVIDLGCGTGFFTFPIATRGAEMVWGVDNSPVQIARAKKLPPRSNVSFIEEDIFVDDFPRADVIVAPFVVNYARERAILQFFFEKCYKQLVKNGKVVLVVDLPTGANLKRFGATKTIVGEKMDGAEIRIDLYNDDKPICTLKSVYYSPETLVEFLTQAGFRNILWHEPLISQEGLMKFEPKFWEGYASNCELGYLSAEK